MASAYHLTYKIPFVDLSGTSYEIRLYKWTDTAPGSVTTLSGSPSPIITHLDDDTDVFAPIRTSSAQISFVDDISIGTIMPTTDTEWNVRLYDVTHTKYVWMGFIVQSAYTQPYIAGPNIVTVNAKSTFAVLLDRPARLRHETNAPASFYDCVEGMCAILEDLGLDGATIYYGYFPNMYTIPNGTHYTAPNWLLETWFSESMYMSKDNDYDSAYRTDPNRDILEDFCKLFRLSLVDMDGMSLAFRTVSRNVDTYYRWNLFSVSSASVSAAAPTLASLTCDDADGTIEYEPNVHSIIIKPKLSDPKVELLEIGSCMNKSSESSANVSVYDDLTGKTYRVELEKIVYTNVCPLITLHANASWEKYRWKTLDFTIYGSEVSVGDTIESEQEVLWFRGAIASGQTIMKIRYNSIPVISKGSVKVSGSICALSDDGIGYYNTGNKMRYPSAGTAETDGNYYPFQAATMGDKDYSAVKVEWKLISSTQGTASIGEGTQTLSREIRFMDGDADAGQWHKFSTSIPVPSNGTYRDYVDVSLISVGKTVSGVIYIIKDLKLEYVAPADDRTDEEYERTNNRISVINGGDEEKNISLALHSKAAQKELTGTIYREAFVHTTEEDYFYMAPLDTVTITPGGPTVIKPEDDLAYCYARQYQISPKSRISMGVRGFHPQPIDLLGTGIMSGYDCNWADDHQDIKMSELDEWDV